MTEKIRSFIAIPLPESVKSHIRTIQDNIRSTGLKMRWVKPENIHLTLKFLGDIPRTDVDAVAGAMDRAAGTISPLSLGAKGIGVFPNIKRPRVLWAGLNGETHELIRLQQNLEQKLEQSLVPLGFKKENRSFKAHLTIARIKQAKHRIYPKDLVQVIEKNGNFESESFTVNEIILYQSVLKPTGAVYTKLKTVSLKSE